MSTVIAALDNSAAAEPVIATAIRFGDLYEGVVRAVNVREDGSEAASAAAREAKVEFESLIRLAGRAADRRRPGAGCAGDGAWCPRPAGR